MSFTDCPVIESLSDPHHREIGELWGTKYWRHWRGFTDRARRSLLAQLVDCSVWQLHRAWYADNVSVALRAALVLRWAGEDEMSDGLAAKRAAYLESLTYRLRGGR